MNSRLLFAAAIAALFAIVFPESAAAQDHQTSFMSQVNIAEWDVPWERTRPRDPYVGPDGLIWFCGQTGGYLASLNPATGEMKRYELGEGAGPHNLIVAPDGMVWYAGNRRAHIGMLNPDTGEITKYDMPDPGARDPHTLVWMPDGNIAFSVQGGNMVGHLDITTGEVILAKAERDNSRPYGIKVAPDGEVWVVLFGTNRIAHFDIENAVLHEFDIPRPEARPRRMEITSDGRVWYGDYAGGYLGVFDPETAEFTEWKMPSGDRSRAYGMAMDDSDTIWLVETGVQPNRFVSFNTKTESFGRSADAPSGGGTIRHMYFDEKTGYVWFGADTNTVGRAIVAPRSGS